MAPDMENIRNLIDPGLNGILFEPGSQRDLVEKILNIYQGYEKFKPIGKSARQKIVTQLNWDENARKVTYLSQRHLNKFSVLSG